ncbi:MAG: ATP-grasp domain-containing protein, partial [Candidatus Heimdallarchaeota archaeon]|nr:ATP-grasp domain-containing protein [Candidatus Heimdallarchaeota archaeon]
MSKENNDSFENSGSFVDLLGSPIVFLHEINTLPNFSKIISQVEGIEKYDRAISIARPDDVILTKTQPEKAYLNWLRNVSLGTDKIIVLNGSSRETLPERVLNNGTKYKIQSYIADGKKPAILSPYFGGFLEQKVSSFLNLEMYSQPQIVRKFDSKINFKNICRKIGVPVIDEDIFTINSKSNQTLFTLVEVVKKKLVETGKVILRGEYGASASTTYVLNDPTSPLLQELISHSNIGDRYMVESFQHTKSDPSSVWFITKNRRIFHLKTSNQILDEETSHMGNEFPVNFDERQIKKLSYKIAKQFAREGYIGPFGLDYIETKDGFFAVECNPRVTGSIYPWELVTRLENQDNT